MQILMVRRMRRQALVTIMFEKLSAECKCY